MHTTNGKIFPMLLFIAVLLLAQTTTGMVVPLSGRSLSRVSDGAAIDVGAALAAGPGVNVCVLGTCRVCQPNPRAPLPCVRGATSC